MQSPEHQEDESLKLAVLVYCWYMTVAGCCRCSGRSDWHQSRWSRRATPALSLSPSLQPCKLKHPCTALASIDLRGVKRPHHSAPSQSEPPVIFCQLASILTKSNNRFLSEIFLFPWPQFEGVILFPWWTTVWIVKHQHTFYIPMKEYLGRTLIGLHSINHSVSVVPCQGPGCSQHMPHLPTYFSPPASECHLNSVVSCLTIHQRFVLKKICWDALMWSVPW